MTNRKLAFFLILPLFIFIIAAAGLAAGAGKTAPPKQAAAPSGEQVKDFGDWRMLCKTPKGGAKQCGAFQRMLFTQKDAKQQIVILETQVRVVADKDNKKVTALRLITPLGALLRPGMLLKVDDQKEVNVAFTQCIQAGCYADLALDAEMVEAMKAGKVMLVAYRLPPGKDVPLKVSMKGFADALDALSKG